MEKNHPKVNYGKTGILLINLGTPDSTNWLDISSQFVESGVPKFINKIPVFP